MNIDTSLALQTMVEAAKIRQYQPDEELAKESVAEALKRQPTTAELLSGQEPPVEPDVTTAAVNDVAATDPVVDSRNSLDNLANSFQQMLEQLNENGGSLATAELQNATAFL